VATRRVVCRAPRRLKCATLVGAVLVQRRRRSFNHAIGRTPLDRRVSAGKHSAERAVRNDAQPVGIVRLNALAVPRLMINSYLLVGSSIDDLCRLLGSAARNNPQTSCRGWSLPVRLRCTRKTGRAQQRNTDAATGSSAFSSRIHPEPNRRSAFSRRLS
jgi:hypothetical protein